MKWTVVAYDTYPLYQLCQEIFLAVRNTPGDAERCVLDYSNRWPKVWFREFQPTDGLTRK